MGSEIKHVLTEIKLKQNYQELLNEKIAVISMERKLGNINKIQQEYFQVNIFFS